MAIKLVASMEDLTDEIPVDTVIDPTMVDEDSLEESITRRADETIEMAEGVETALEAMGTVSELYADLSAKETITPQDINHFIGASSMAFESVGLEFNQVFPGLESLSDQPVLAMEAAENSVSQAALKIGTIMKSALAGLAGDLALMVNFLDFQKHKLDALKLKVAQMEGKVTLTIPNSIYMCYGDNEVVKTPEEYLNRLKDTAATLNIFMSAQGRFVRNDLGNSLAMLFKFLSNDKFKKDFSRIVQLIEAMDKVPGMKTTQKFPSGMVGRMSDTKLGMYRILLVKMQESDYNMDDVSELKRVVGSFDFIAIREKFKSDKQPIVFENVDKKFALAILEEAIQLNQNYRYYCRLANKVSTFGSFFVTQDMFNKAISAPVSMGVSLIPFLFANYRLLVKTSVLIAKNTGICFSLSKGHTKKIISILKQI